MEEILGRVESRCDSLSPVIHYVFQCPGKRLRSRLLLLAAQTVGVPGPWLPEASALVELLHNGTLLHDDVMDRASVRRNRPTVNRLWGDAVAILAGDFLLAAVMDLALKTGHPAIPRAAVDTLMELVAGQMEEIRHQGNLLLGEAPYFQVIRKKTASLFAFSCRIGAWLSRASAEQSRSLEEFGRAFGLAFQLVDDLLDYVGQPEHTGKEPGRDLAEGKVTLPLLTAFARGSLAEREKMRDLFSSTRRQARLAEFSAIIEARGGFSHTMQKARACTREALGFLARFSPSEARREMEEIACSVADQVVCPGESRRRSGGPAPTRLDAHATPRPASLQTCRISPGGPIGGGHET